MRYIRACEHGTWHLCLKEKGTSSGPVKRVPYRCRSWRHAGQCALWRGAQDWTRVRDALLSRDHWSYIVLTFRRREDVHWFGQYTQACSIWSKMRLRLRRAYGDIEYIQTWERFRAGGLHVNLVISNQAIAELVDDDWRKWRKQVLKPMAREVGFGHICWVERLRTHSEQAMAGYLTKLAKELTGTSAKSQVPYDAPPHFRRLRASQGLLPPILKSDLTGWISFTPLITDDGEIVVNKIR